MAGASQWGLQLSLADARSQPILEVSPLIGSRQKSEYKQVAVGAHWLFFLTSENKVIRQPFEVVHGEVSISVERDDVTPAAPHSEYVNAIFPSRDSGDCLVVSKEEDTLFVGSHSSSCVLLEKLHGFKVLSVLWLSSELVKKHVVLGTKQGNVLEVSFSNVSGSPREVSLLRLLDFDPLTPVLHLTYEVFPANQHLGCVYLSTRDGIYFLTGPRSVPESQSLSPLFQRYKDDPTALRNAMSAAPSPGETSYTQIYHRADGTAESFVFLSGTVMMYSCIPDKPESEGSCIVEIKSLPLPTSLHDSPQGCGISAQYLYLLYADRLLVYSRQTLQLASSTLLTFSGCLYRGLVYDPQMQVILVWSNQVFVVHLQDEGRMQWVFLAEQRKFDESLAACRFHSPKFEPTAKGIYADALVASGEVDRAVELYIDSDKPVEEVVDALSSQSLAGLHRYLACVYERLPAEQSSQRVLVAQTLLALLLAAKASKGEVLALLRKCSRTLNFNATVQSLQRAARIEELVDFCRERQAFQHLFRHFLNSLDYHQALDVLPQCPVPDIVRNLTDHSAVFVQAAPAVFYRTLKTLCQAHPEVSILPIITAIRATPEGCLQTSASFLHAYIEARQCSDMNVHNCYVYHLSLMRDQKTLESYLSEQAAVYQRQLCFDFDPELALSFLTETGLSKTIVTLLTHLFRFREAVKKSLDISELPLAEKTAAQPMVLADLIQAEMEKVTILTHAKIKDFAYLLPPHIVPQLLAHSPQKKDMKRIEDQYRLWSKALWLQIAEWHHLRGDNRAVLQIPAKCAVVEFADVVPFLDEKVQFSDIREDVKGALRKYAEDIANFKLEAEACRQKSDLIRKEQEKKSSECIQGDVTQPCGLCQRPMNRDSAFLFPCLHAFHESCITQFYLENNVRGVSQVVQSLIARLGETDHRRDLRNELLETLATECCFCCDAYIETIKLPLADDERERDAWDLGAPFAKP